MEEKKRFSGVEKLSTGDRAALRRLAGCCLRQADAGALRAFYSALPAGTAPWEQERCFAVMCLMCLWKPEECRAAKPVPECLAVINRQRSTNGMDGRFRALLDTPWNDDEGYLAAKLARIVRQIRAAGLSLYPDFEQLFTDLMNWNNDANYVQRRWMEQYLSAGRDENKNEEN